MQTSPFEAARQQALQKLAAAQEAQRQQQLAQQAPAMQIAAAQQQLVQVDRDEAQAHADVMRQRIAEAATWSETQAQALAARLDQFSRSDEPSLIDLLRMFDDKRAEAKQLYQDAYNDVAVLEVQRSLAEPVPPRYEDRGEDIKQHYRVDRGHDWARRACAIGAAPLSSHDALILWIADSQGKERQARRGIVFNLIGQLYDPGPEWRPDRGLNRLLDQTGLNWA